MKVRKRLNKYLRYWLWRAGSYLCRNRVTGLEEKALAIIAGFHPARMKNIDPLVRYLLKCDFIDTVLITNNNPELNIGDQVTIRDRRLEMVDQPVRRGPGYCWDLAIARHPEFVLLVDDDFLVSATQVECLFRHLIARPDIPHGVVGHMESRHCKNQEKEVRLINEIYAVSRPLLERYHVLVRGIRDIDESAFAAIEDYAHEVIISKSGSGYPRIHHIGRVLRCPTYKKPGVAIHKKAAFPVERKKVINALEMVLAGN